ncbi:MAG: hypothetical protein COA75_12475 [Cellvibrionales bacterium]|nr:MAG: hypothetical protein COA75_12475 [Cellvibrionales bacterium]
MSQHPATNEILIYQQAGKAVEVRLDGDKNTVWLAQAQLVALFERDQSVISRHVRNVFNDGELAEKSNMQKVHIAHSDKPVTLYSLDVIISVGYRVKSPQGVKFRQWATQRLRDYLVQGYAINQQRFDQNAAELQQAIALIRKAAQSPELTAEAGSGLVEIVSRYTQTFLWLQQYDEGLLNEPQGQPGGNLPSPEAAMAVLNELKATLIQRGEATDLFARLREDGLSSILGNLNQSVFGEPAYPTIESKAAHLLYFVVKNHPFSDGNKRSGAFLFVDFLHRNGRLLNARDETVINDTGLAALTLLIAESDPRQKEMLIRLVMTMLAKDEE